MYRRLRNYGRVRIDETWTNEFGGGGRIVCQGVEKVEKSFLHKRRC